MLAHSQEREHLAQIAPQTWGRHATAAYEEIVARQKKQLFKLKTRAGWQNMGVGRKHGYEIDLNMLWLEIRRFLIFNTNSLWKSFLITEGGKKNPNKSTTLTNGQHVYEDIT